MKDDMDGTWLKCGPGFPCSPVSCTGQGFVLSTHARNWKDHLQKNSSDKPGAMEILTFPEIFASCWGWAGSPEIWLNAKNGDGTQFACS